MARLIRRLGFFFSLAWRRYPGDERISPGTAWQVACILEPWHD